jgi:hypothetical protein
VDRLLLPPSGTAVAASTEDVVVLVVVVAISGDDITRNEKKRTNNFRDSRNEKRFSAQCIEHGVAPRVQELFLQQKEEVMMNAGGGEKNEKRGVDASSSPLSPEELAHATCPTHSHSQVFQNLKH